MSVETPAVLVATTDAELTSVLRRGLAMEHLEIDGRLRLWSGPGTLLLEAPVAGNPQLVEIETAMAVGHVLGRYPDLMAAGLIAVATTPAVVLPALATSVELPGGAGSRIIDNLFAHDLPEVRVGPSRFTADGPTGPGQVELPGAAGFVIAAGGFLGPEYLFVVVVDRPPGADSDPDRATAESSAIDVARRTVAAMQVLTNDRLNRHRLATALAGTCARLRLTQSQRAILARAARKAAAYGELSAVIGHLDDQEVVRSTAERNRRLAELLGHLGGDI